MDCRFSPDLGDVGGLTFFEVFTKFPKWVEFATTWTGSTGIFKKFASFVQEQLLDNEKRLKHVQRCREYIKNTKLGEIPRYMLKYVG